MSLTVINKRNIKQLIVSEEELIGTLLRRSNCCFYNIRVCFLTNVTPFPLMTLVICLEGGKGCGGVELAEGLRRGFVLLTHSFCSVWMSERYRFYSGICSFVCDPDFNEISHRGSRAPNLAVQESYSIFMFEVTFCKTILQN